MNRTLSLALACVAIAACSNDDWDPARLARGEGHVSDEQLKRGRQTYQTYCAGCHGEEGDGNGPAAKFLSPKPRDFRKGRIKFASVAAGTPPRDEDYLRVITHGLAGTSMPSWRFVPQEERNDVIAYVRTFAPQSEPPGAAVPIPPDPFAKHPERGVAEGERVYHGLAACTSCHPAYATKDRIRELMKESDVPFSGFRERMYESEPKDSEWGEVIKPPDFLVDHVKSASTRDDLVRVIAAGVGGTAMPSWGESLKPKQLWGLAYYVESLVEKRGTAEAAAIKSQLAEQDAAALPAKNP
ncbi:MAG TPA: c-type cytochrome [Minicystis sp.]|nr:c-type cytochrome [Minicystis sp.]